MQLDYNNSGIKTLRVSSSFFLGVSILASLICIPSWYTDDIYHRAIHWNMIALSLIFLVFGFFLYGLGHAIATIAENALLNKELKEKELLLEEDKENKNTHINDLEWLRSRSKITYAVYGLNLKGWYNKNGGVSVGNDSTSKSSDNEQRILLLENEVKHLNELLVEKERIIQVLLKNS